MTRVDFRLVLLLLTLSVQVFAGSLSAASGAQTAQDTNSNAYSMGSLRTGDIEDWAETTVQTSNNTIVSDNGDFVIVLTNTTTLPTGDVVVNTTTTNLTTVQEGETSTAVVTQQVVIVVSNFTGTVTNASTVQDIAIVDGETVTPPG